jgi:hypothetical protein
VNKNAGLSVGVFALLALVARVGVPAGSGQASTDQPDRVSPAARAVTPAPVVASPSPSYEGPWMATRHFFAHNQLPSSSAKVSGSPAVDLRNPEDLKICAGNAGCLKKLRQFFGVRDTDRIACLLATVPDPYHTRLALFTDNTIDGIWKGAGATDWQFSTQWLPWSDTIDSKEGDPTKRAEEREVIRQQEKQPGLLVFRRAQSEDLEPPEALLIFVVGETPTAGVNPDQFQIARAYMETLGPYRRSDTVKIVGPTFSGSFHSLAELIVQDQIDHPGKFYQVHSGTATSLRAKEAFELRAGLSVEFHAATENIRDQRNQFQELLEELRIPKARAAVLAEGGSAFGRAAADAGVQEDVRVYRFPRDISHLRDSYRQAVQSSKSDGTPAPSLDFSLKDSSVGEDSVPTYSPTQTPLSQNGVINEIIRTMRRDDVRIVEISATNVLDLLFLAGVLRRECPDTRLLIDTADLLFVQSQQTQPLTGALFLASYPLFNESKLWENRREVIVFPDARSEGVFNATVLSLGNEAQRTKVLDYAWQQVHHPAAWLLTLDRRGFTPVRTWAGDVTSCWYEPVHGKHGFPAPGLLPASRLLGLVSNAFALFSVGICIWTIRLGWKKTWVVDARFSPLESGDSWRSFYLFLFLLILTGIQIVIQVARPPGSGWPLLFLLGCGLCTVTVSYVAFDQCRRTGNSHLARKQCLAMGLALAVVLACVLLWIFCCPNEDSRRQLFFFRAAELRFGSSPLWPIVAPVAALLLWCCVHVTRLYFASCQEPQVLTGIGSLLKDVLAQSHSHFSGSAHSALGFFSADQRRRFWIVLAAAVLLCIAYRINVHFASVDGVAFDALCVFLQLLVAALLLLTCWQIRVLSKSLLSFTTSLDVLPLAQAFVPACAQSGNRPIWVRRLNLQSLDIQENAVLLLHDLRLQREQLTKLGLHPGRVDFWYRLYRDQVAGLLNADSHSRGRSGYLHRKLRFISTLVAQRMWTLILRPAWASKPLLGRSAAAPSSPEEPTPDTKEKAAPEAERGLRISGDPTNVVDLAETFLALHYSPFLLYGVRQIQNLLWFPCIGFVLLMFSVNSYNFQAPHLIGRLLLILFLAVAWILGTSLMELERDAILSRISGTKPGELGVAFYLKLARYAALPVLGLLASQFPSISNSMLSWVEPALEALN